MTRRKPRNQKLKKVQPQPSSEPLTPDLLVRLKDGRIVRIHAKVSAIKLQEGDEILGLDVFSLKKPDLVVEDPPYAQNDSLKRESFTRYRYRYKEALVQVSAPPKNAEFLLSVLLHRDERDAVIGDFIERYGTIHRRLGKRRADLYAYYEVVRSLYPLLKRILLKTGIMVLLGEWVRKLTH